MKARKKKAIRTKPMNPHVAKLAQRLKSLRLKKGYTSYETFAYDHELSRALYGRYEKGKDMRFSSLVKVVKAFDMSLEKFFSEDFD